MITLKKLTTNEGMFYGLYLLATFLSIIALFLLLSVYNNTSFPFLNSDEDKFYGLFALGFVLCALVIDSSTKFSGWSNIFVLLSIILGIALFGLLVLFFYNIDLGILTTKSDFIYLLGVILKS